MRLIDADKLYIGFLKARKDIHVENRYEGSSSGFSTILVERILNAQPAVEAVTVRQYEELQAKNETLKQLASGEWVDCDAVMVAMGIDFATGLRMFDFCRTAEWNPKPLNGQKITTKFRLKRSVNNETD